MRAEAAPGSARWSACYAPHTTMYFDQLGRVRACCQNSGTLLGDIATATIREVWESASADRLRGALEHDDYGEGCQFCGWQLAEGNESILFARDYDEPAPVQRRPRWPERMEFALTNTCNLQCVMCNGEWSSAIRSRRERRAPLPAAYGEAFFAELAEFLPHLRKAQFAGGEPFLGSEPLRVMEMLAALDEPPEVTIITNGTQLTPRVRRIVERLRPRLIVSIDGATPATYDRIRVGSHLPDVLANLDAFIDLVGTDHVSITTCLMASNWHEFHDVLALAEQRDLDVGVNVVRFPREHSPYRMDPDHLVAMVRTLQATTVALTGPRLAAWQGHVSALAHRADAVLAGSPVPDLPGVALPFAESGRAGATGTPVASGAPEAHFGLDLTGRLTEERLDHDLAIDLAGLDGRYIDDLTDRMATSFGNPKDWEILPRSSPEDDDRLWLIATDHVGGADATEPVGDHEVIQYARRDPAGRLVGAGLVVRAVTPSGWPTLGMTLDPQG